MTQGSHHPAGGWTAVRAAMWQAPGSWTMAPWRLLRLAPIGRASVAFAGPYCCAPERDGLEVTFTRWSTGPPDDELHPD